MDNNINTLDELNKGCCMVVDALDIILEKVDNNEKQVKEEMRLSISALIDT